LKAPFGLYQQKSNQIQTHLLVHIILQTNTYS
jgi:hypothetical protein